MESDAILAVKAGLQRDQETFSATDNMFFALYSTGLGEAKLNTAEHSGSLLKGG